MADLLETIKKIVIQTVNAHNETKFYFGTIMTASPLKIKIDDKLILTNEFVTNLSHVGTLINGDKVFLLKYASGEFVILGKVVT